MDGRERGAARLLAGRPVADAAFVLVGALTLLVAVLAPVLVQLAAQPSATPAVVAVLALAVAAYVALGSPRLLPRPVRGRAPSTSYDAWPTLRARVLDPERHPRRPRAPGCC